MKPTHFVFLLLAAVNLAHWPLGEISIAGSAPVPALILVAYIALRADPYCAFIAGWTAGLAHDASSGAAFGISSLAWGPLALALAKSRRYFDSESIVVSTVMTALFAGAAQAVFAFLFTVTSGFRDTAALLATSSASAVLTAVVAPFIFKALAGYDRRFGFIAVPKAATNEK